MQRRKTIANQSKTLLKLLDFPIETSIHQIKAVLTENNEFQHPDNTKNILSVEFLDYQNCKAGNQTEDLQKGANSTTTKL